MKPKCLPFVTHVVLILLTSRYKKDHIHKNGPYFAGVCQHLPNIGELCTLQDHECLSLSPASGNIYWHSWAISHELMDVSYCSC